ncbi:MAG TPA: heme-copper oxidase subunit III [Pyrinomonadaceae bacterium]|nr:heme-copper oxidase subunit III [Pyrinomonadaceae bacterium]
MVTSTKTVTKPGKGGSSKFPGPNGNGKKNGHEFFDSDSRAHRYRIGMWVALASIAMMFTALSSAYIVRAASANDWFPLLMPRVLLASTAIILASSATFEAARRKLKASMISGYSRWLVITALLGLAFLGSQFIAWRQLRAQGVYMATNPHSSFFYLLTAAHALHLFGGLMALLYLLVRARHLSMAEAVDLRRRAVADAVGIYWHFMDVLWIYLFLLLFFWR